jgi:DMSO reductase anchor subunit
MKTNKNVQITSWAITGFSFLFVGLTYFAFWIEGFTAIYLLLVVGLIGLVLMGLIGRRIITVVIHKNYKLLISPVIGLLALVIVIFQPVEKIIESQKSPVVWLGFCEHTVTSTSILLRKNKTFEYNAGAFLSTVVFYGKYEIKGDTLVLLFNQTPPENLKEKLLFIDNGLVEIADSNVVTQYFIPTINKLNP